jgi:hypothetical protein
MKQLDEVATRLHARRLRTELLQRNPMLAERINQLSDEALVALDARHTIIKAQLMGDRKKRSELRGGGNSNVEVVR